MAEQITQGVHNLINWKISPNEGENAALFNDLASGHELLHDELNWSTGYGAMMATCAQMASLHPENPKYKADLVVLQSRSKIAHEAFASWMGAVTSAFYEPEKIEFFSTYLRSNEEYRFYYDVADRFAESISSLFFKACVVRSAIRICFQSKILFAALQNMDTFQPAQIRNREYPDFRLTYLLERLQPDFFQYCLSDFADQNEGRPAYQFIVNELNGIPQDGLDTLDDINLAYDVGRFVFDALKKQFDRTGSDSLAFDYEHLPSYDNHADKHFFVGLDSGKNSTYPFNKGDFNTFLKAMLFNYEKEILMIGDQALRCRILHPEQMNEAQRRIMLNGDPVTRHIFVIIFEPLFFREEYTFDSKEDEDWFFAQEGPVYAIRTFEMVGADKVVWFIPFAELLLLFDFLQDKPAEVEVFVCAGASALMSDKRPEIAYYLKNEWPKFCLKADLSFIHHLEGVVEGVSFSNYSCILYQFNGRQYYVGVIAIGTPDEQMLMVMMFSNMHEYFFRKYLRSRYPAIELNYVFKEEQMKIVDKVCAHMFQEERTYQQYILAD